MLKQVILIRKDLELSKGKLAAQACHASLKAYRKSKKQNPRKTSDWIDQGGKKIILWVENKEEMKEIEREIPKKIPKASIKDAGYTELEPGTWTTLGIGPWEEEKLDKYTGNLKTVK